MIDHVKSYYSASSEALPPFPTLQGEHEADICIIGGGLTGIASALYLRKRGYKVILLEAARIGWGASGRNGGQINTGLRKSPGELIPKFGLEKARMLFGMAEEAKQMVKDHIVEYGISCDLKPGVLFAANKPSDISWMKEEVQCLEEKVDYKHARFLTKEETRQEVASDCYHGAILDTGALHLHPLKYCFGLAQAAIAAGAKFYEQSRAVKIQGRKKPIVHTANGLVKAHGVIVGCNGYLGKIMPEIAGKIFPIANYLIATEPLSEAEAKVLIPRDVAICDTKFVVDYYRLSADRRLIFGGGEKYSSHEPKDIANFVRPYMLRVFPQLAGKRIEYAWGGILAVTQSRLPHFGRVGDVYFAQGYSGQGLAMTGLAGKLIAESVASVSERFDIFAKLPNPVFPGGTLFRYPAQVLGMLYYALRDRL